MASLPISSGCAGPPIISPFPSVILGDPVEMNRMRKRCQSCPPAPKGQCARLEQLAQRPARMADDYFDIKFGAPAPTPYGHQRSSRALI